MREDEEGEGYHPRLRAYLRHHRLKGLHTHHRHVPSMPKQPMWLEVVCRKMRGLVAKYIAARLPEGNVVTSKDRLGEGDRDIVDRISS